MPNSPFLVQAPNILRDALYNCDPDSGSDPDYARGVIVGVMAGLMASTGESFDRLLPIVMDCMPKRFDYRATPQAWRDAMRDWRKIREALDKRQSAS